MIVLLAVLSVNSWAQKHRVNRKFGPNLYTSADVAIPLKTDNWVPDGMLALQFDWYEPLLRDYLFTPLSHNSKFLHFNFATKASPFMANLNTGMGIKILPRIEFDLLYSLSGYLGSNVIFPENGFVNQTTYYWRGKYIYEQLYQNTQWAYEQRVAGRITGDLSVGRMLSILDYTYSLIETSGVRDDYTYDYFLNMPIQGKDYLSVLSWYSLFAVHANWHIAASAALIQTGDVWDFLKDRNNYKFRQCVTFIGPQYQVAKHEITGQVGMFLRTKEQFKDYDQTLSALLLRLAWSYRWF